MIPGTPPTRTMIILTTQNTISTIFDIVDEPPALVGFAFSALSANANIHALHIANAIVQAMSESFTASFL